MKSYLNQGANDPLKPDDRESVLSTLKQYVNSIFTDEANTDYSGRYVFTGYRTDTSLLFPENTDKLSYQIKENFSYDSFDNITVVTGGANYDQTVTNGQDYIDATAKTNEVYQLRLAYNNCSKDASGLNILHKHYSHCCSSLHGFQRKCFFRYRCHQLI